jgi:hypothetical protein
MPFPIHVPRFRRLAHVAAGAVLLSCLAPALASACTLSSAPSSQVFAKYGDSNEYQLAPNGIFAGASTAGWSLLNARMSPFGPGLVSGDGHSVVIGAGGRLTTPTMCVGTTTPTVRFMTRHMSFSTGGVLFAYVRWQDWAGNLHDTYLGWTGGSSTWTPSVPVNVSALPLWESGSTLQIRLELVPAVGFGAWAVDDFFLDPYSRG